MPRSRRSFAGLTPNVDPDGLEISTRNPATGGRGTRRSTHGCSAFVTRVTFWRGERQSMKKFLTTEGDVWLRKTARAAAVADILLVPWTSAVSPRAWHSSA